MAKSRINRLVFQTDLSAFNIAFNKTELDRHKGVAGLKYYLVVYYIRRWVGYFGEFYLSMNALLTGCGYSSTERNNHTTNQFKDIITELINEGYIIVDCDVMKLKPNDMFKIKLSQDKNLFYAGSKKGFVVVSLQEVSDMIEAKTDTSKGTLLAVYLTIKKYIYNSQWPIGFPARDTMADALGISVKTIEKALDELVKNSFLFKGECLYVADRETSNCVYPARAVYALDEQYLRVDRCLEELSRFYDLPVYTKDELSGKRIRYLKRKKDTS